MFHKMLTKTLFCADNNLTELDVSQNVNLNYLDCNNDITELDVSQVIEALSVVTT